MLNLLHRNKKISLVSVLLFCFISSDAIGGRSIKPIDVASFPPIHGDIEALASYSAYSKIAGQHLVERGVEILTQAHGVLADPNAPFVQRMQLVTVLGGIADESSANIIIEAAEQNINNRYLYQNALLALSNFEPTEEITAFVNRQLDKTKRDPLIQRSALNYYAKQPDDNASQWVEKYALNKDASPEVRYAALYMAGMNGVELVKEPIAQVLDKTTSVTREKYLLLGFANVAASLEEFNAFVSSKNLNTDNVKEVREFLKFRLANLDEKKNLAPELLNSNQHQLKKVVVNHLVNEKDAESLAKSWQSGDSLVRATVKRAGYNISLDEHGASFEAVEKKQEILTWIYTILLSILLIGLFLWQSNRADTKKLL